jgi:hypothetical protein
MSLQRQPVVHHGEDALLHLAAVPGAADDGDVLLDIEDDEDLGVEAVALPVPVRQLAGVVDREVGSEGCQVGITGADEHVLDEVGLPGEFGDEADRFAGFLVGAAEAVGHVKVLAREIVEHLGMQFVEDFRRHRLIEFAPGDILEGWELVDEVLVFGERPVNLPVSTIMVPLAAIRPSAFFDSWAKSSS